MVIPGPLRSFLRMAGISQEASREQILPLFGHFVEIYGYKGSKGRSAKPTEALILFKRYFAQAKKLESLAGPGRTIHFRTCKQAEPLLAILGYRLPHGCQGSRVIEVRNAEKAFSTVDSGFPLADLQQDLLEGKPFRTRYPSPRLPLIYTTREWTGKRSGKGTDLIEQMADHPTLARLYWALSRVDGQTRELLRRSVGVQRMLPLASALDFYGSNLTVRGGRVVVPGGSAEDAAWGKLVGASPARPTAFMVRLLRKDRGALAEYYDTLARAPAPQLRYFTRRDHLRRFYAAFRDHDSSPDALRSSFRPGAKLLLLVARLPLDAQGEPLVPGGLAVWARAFRQKSASKMERRLAQEAGRWTSSEQLLAGFVALSRTYSENGPVDMYLTLSEIDRERGPGRPMSPSTVRLLIKHFPELRDQYQIFSEFPGLDDSSVERFVAMTQKIDRIRDPLLRGDMMGIFEANLGLWQIFERQGQIDPADLNDSWQRVIDPFAHVKNSAELFDAGRASLTELMQAVTGTTLVTQEEMVDLLAGPEQSTSEGQEVHDRIAGEIGQVFSDQRLVSLDTLLELGSDFDSMKNDAHKVDPHQLLALATQLKEARSPRAMFTAAERAEWAPGDEPNEHILREMKTDPHKLLRLAAKTGNAACGALAPYLRDALVGLNYAYYQPPGAEVLRSSPRLVRSHDFLASESLSRDAAWRAPHIFDAGLAAAHGTHLSGSLAGLPYALADMEQDLIVPRKVQMLVWRGVAAEILTASVIPRWWSTSQEALHAAALYQKTGEELMAGAAKHASLRTAVLEILSHQLPPETIDHIRVELSAGRMEQALHRITPAAEFHLTAEFQKRFPGKMAGWGPAGAELEQMIERDPQQASPEYLSQEFGVPHPFLAQNYGDQILNLQLFPSLMSYASELLAESWESTNLYWARLADEMGDPPVMLNELAPRMALRMVENIASSDFDDWPALNRAMRETGHQFLARRTPGPSVNASLAPLAPAN